MYKIIIYIQQAPSDSKMFRLCFCLKKLHLVNAVSHRLYYVLDNFFLLMSFGIEVLLLISCHLT